MNKKTTEKTRTKSRAPKAHIPRDLPIADLKHVVGGWAAPKINTTQVG